MESTRPWDVIVIGAGPAGLCAAYELQQAGLRPVVLEARERIGGRVFTVRDGFERGQFAEGGAEYLDVEWRRVSRYISAFGLKPAPTRDPYDYVVFRDIRHSFLHPDKSQLPPEIAAEITSNLFSYDLQKKYFRPLWKRLMDEHGGDEEAVWDALVEMSAYQVAKEAGATLDELSYIRMRLAPDEGVELDKVYATQLDDPGWPSDYPRYMYQIEGGNDRLIEAFAERIAEPVRTGCVVTRVCDDDQGVEVFYQCEGEERSLQASYALLAVPTQPLKKIHFSPELPKPRKLALQSVEYAPVIKVLVQFRKRYWRERGWNGTMSTEHPVCVWNPTLHQEGDEGILCFYSTALMAIKLREMAEEQRIEFLLATLQQHELLPDDVEVLQVRTLDWVGEEFSGGGWCFYPLGVEEDLIELLKEPVGRLYFAGEYIPDRTHSELDEDLLDTIESALSSGMAASRAIVKRSQAAELKRRKEAKARADDVIYEAIESEAFLRHIGVDPAQAPSQPIAPADAAEGATSAEKNDAQDPRFSAKKPEIAPAGGIFELIGPSKPKD